MKLRWKDPTRRTHRLCFPDHILEDGMWCATGTGKYPRRYDVEVYFPPTGVFDWYQNERYMSCRFSDGIWWIFNSSPAIYRAVVHSPTQPDLALK
jgi:hypothetical protein